MLLHETRNDDGIKSFFNDVWECYVKTLLNPFYAVDKVIKRTVFENKVKAIAKVTVPRERKGSNAMLTPAISITLQEYNEFSLQGPQNLVQLIQPPYKICYSPFNPPVFCFPHFNVIYRYFPRCLLFQAQNRRTGSCTRSLSTVFNSRAKVLLSYIECIAE